MKLTRTILCAAMMCLPATVLSQPTEPSATGFFKRLDEGRSQTVVLYGTSLTEGGAWPYSMRKWFDQQHPKLVTVVNSGGSGQNSDWGLAKVAEKVLKHKPDLVFIEFSYNDAHEKFRLTPEKALENLRAIIGGIRSANAEVIIVLQIMNIPWDSPGGTKSASARPNLEKFNENYRILAKEKGYLLVDHYPEWKRLSEEEPELFRTYIPDGSHPTAEGSRAVTWPGIQRLLETAREAVAN